MPTFKLKFRVNAGSSTGKIVYQVIHRRVVRRITSSIELSTDCWDASRGKIICTSSAAKEAHRQTEHHLTILHEISTRLASNNTDYSVDDIVTAFRCAVSGHSFGAVVDTEIQYKLSQGKRRTARAYRSAYDQLRVYNGGDLCIEDIKPGLIERFQDWLQARKVSSNTISFYMRNLRSLYNRGVRSGLTADCKPFGGAYTGVAKTKKRAITEAELKKVLNLDLSHNPKLGKSRDLFFLSFYCLGISFVDLVGLKKHNLSGDRITYRRSKTGQTISFAVNAKIKALLKKYAVEGPSEYLLDIIDENDPDAYRQYHNAICQFNRHLKEIGKLAQLRTTLTSYVARHTWASIARTKDIKLQTISDALGHENEATTRIYLASIDTGHVDRANEIITRGL